MENFKQQIDALVSGEIEQIEVSREDFFDFRNVWQEHPEKSRIIGEAHLGGSVIYTYIK